MAKKRLLIDLGHSEKFPGANGYLTEVQWNRSILPHLLDQLDKDLWDVVQVPTEFTTIKGYRTSRDSNENLVQRIRWINENSTSKDFLISIHGNAAGRDTVRGVTTCYMGGSGVAETEAKILSSIYQSVTGVPVWLTGAFDDRKARFGRLGMVRDTEPTALLIEAGFVSNKQDMEVAPALAAKAIALYYNHLANPSYSMPNDPVVNQPVPVPTVPGGTPPSTADLDLAHSVGNISTFLVNNAPVIGNMDPSIMGNPVTRADTIRITSRLITVLRESIQREQEAAATALQLRADLEKLKDRVFALETGTTTN